MRRRSGVKFQAIWTGGSRQLKGDRVFGPWVSKIGLIRVPEISSEPFFYLARTIIYQQLAGPAARTIHERFIEALRGEVTPRRVTQASDDTIRNAGLSANKLAALRDLANKVTSGEVCIHDLDKQTDEEVTRRLTLVRGIGPWTAHMYMMFQLHRPDIWPVGDLGVRSGFAKVHGLDSAPSQKLLERLGELYRPWRSAAAFYCWRALEHELS